jgi:hypothetical protein
MKWLTFAIANYRNAGWIEAQLYCTGDYLLGPATQPGGSLVVDVTSSSANICMSSCASLRDDAECASQLKLAMNNGFRLIGPIGEIEALNDETDLEKQDLLRGGPFNFPVSRWATLFCDVISVCEEIGDSRHCRCAVH